MGIGTLLALVGLGVFLYKWAVLGFPLLPEAETEIELIRSRRVIEAVVDELDLHVQVRTPAGPKRPREVFATFDSGRDAFS